MNQTAKHLRNLIYLILILFIKGTSPCFAQIGDDIIYDTVWVYDTVWEYETIYDTVWEYETVYDTVEIENGADPYALIEPITISNLQFSSHYYKANTYQKRETYVPKTKVKRSVLSKVRYELKRNRDQFRGWDNGSDMGLTLNPTKGTFNPKILKQGIYSVEAYSGVAFQNTIYDKKSTENPILTNKDSVNELPTLEYGIRMNYNLFQYGIQSGIGITQVRDEFNYTEINERFDSTAYKLPDYKWKTYTDSVWVTNIDSAQYSHWYYFEVDTLHKDSAVHYNYVSKTYIRSVINTISYLEIPLILTYELAFSRLGVQLKLGGINQIHMYSKGKVYKAPNKIVDIKDFETFTKYNIALYSGIGLKYRISYDVSFVLDAYYKHPFLKFSESSEAAIRRRSFGINAGLRYRF